MTTTTTDTNGGPQPTTEQGPPASADALHALVGEYRAEVDRLSGLLDEAGRRCQAHTPPDAIGSVLAALDQYAASNTTQRYAARAVMLRVASNAAAHVARMYLVDAAILVRDEYPAAERLVVHIDDETGDDDPILWRVYDADGAALWDGFDGQHMPEQRDQTAARAVENAWQRCRILPEISRDSGGSFTVDLPATPSGRQGTDPLGADDLEALDLDPGARF
jgi:uncharacterized ParB-like nuclease family protein